MLNDFSIKLFLVVISKAISSTVIKHAFYLQKKVYDFFNVNQKTK